MGFLRDLKQLNDTGKQMQKQAGIQTGFKGMKQAVAQANATLGDMTQANGDAARLMQSGTVATGLIAAIRNTDVLINYSPQIEFDIDVTIPGQPAYRVTHRQLVNPVHIPQVQPGSAVPLRVDPMDVNTVWIVGV